MFKLEKIFQVNDAVYINLSIFWKSLSIFLSIYIFSILEFNSIFDLFNFNIYKSSKYFYLSIILTVPGIHTRDKSLLSISTIILCSLVSLIFFLKY